jgi:ubiquinone/menaquinone biosynthesis C-methylase UbiE
MYAQAQAPAYSEANERVRRTFEKAAPHYDAAMSVFEKVLMADGRDWVCSQAEGRVLEIAVGTGRNLSYYPDGVDLIGVDLSPAMLERAEHRARELDRKVELREGNAERLEFDDGTFDTVVSTLSLCTIPDDHAAIEEISRVLRPGGSFVFCEHVRSPARAVRMGQRVMEPVCVHLEDDHLLRDPLDHIDGRTLVIDELERYRWGIMERASLHKPRFHPRTRGVSSVEVTR